MAELKKSLKGRIVLIQEDRFPTDGESGKGYLFTLYRTARPDQEGLKRWQDANIKILVRYAGEPDLAWGKRHGPVPWKIKH